jgi:hypothetical protein
MPYALPSRYREALPRITRGLSLPLGEPEPHPYLAISSSRNARSLLPHMRRIFWGRHSCRRGPQY